MEYRPVMDMIALRYSLWRNFRFEIEAWLDAIARDDRRGAEGDAK